MLREKNHKKKERVLGMVRHGLTVVAGALVTKGVIDESFTEEIIGVGMAIAALIWSIQSKK